MIEYLIRAAEPRDLTLLLEFEQALIAAERPFAQNLRAGKIHYYDLPALIERDDSQLVVLEVGGKIAACGYAQIRNSEAHHATQQHAYLGFMYTTPEQRGQGLNQKLLEHLEHWSLRRGVNHFRLDVYSGNTAAIKAYLKSGFSEHMIEMVKHVPLDNNEAD